MQTVLLVEDDSKLATIMRAFLQENGFSVEVEGNGGRAVDRILAIKPDAVVLDINFCLAPTDLRSANRSAPFIRVRL